MTLPQNLDGYAKAVPTITHPVYWDTELPVVTNLHVIDRWIGYYASYLPEGDKIDEAAILVPSLFHRTALALELGRNGWVTFNQARDLVFTSPFGTRYFVKYLFLKNPSRPYRLEIMLMDAGEGDDQPGFSPLHAALWQPNGEAHVSSGATKFPIPHLSFKPTRLPAGESAGRSYSRAVQYLKDGACIHVQTGQSTYGRFGYYLHQDAQRQIYIKPRVNTRDAR